MQTGNQHAKVTKATAKKLVAQCEKALGTLRAEIDGDTIDIWFVDTAGDFCFDARRAGEKAVKWISRALGGAYWCNNGSHAWIYYRGTEPRGFLAEAARNNVD
jgi:hypothetical protein